MERSDYHCCGFSSPESARRIEWAEGRHRCHLRALAQSFVGILHTLTGRGDRLKLCTAGLKTQNVDSEEETVFNGDILHLANAHSVS